MKVVLLILAMVVSLRTSTATSTYLEKSKAFLEFLSSSIKSVISSIEETAEDLVDVIVNVKPSSVTLYYYNQSSIDDYIVSFTLANTSSLHSVFNASKESFYMIHGYVSSYSSNVNTVIKAAVLGSYDVNYFIVDWPANTGYVYAYDSVPYVGTYLGEFINNVSATYNYSNSNVKLAGHSLGAHICGKVGQVTNRTIAYIVGMDPAGPLYNLEDDVDARLSPDDAPNVQAIHTNSDLYGIKLSVGRSDFWVNGGGTQPGCNAVTDIEFCSHKRSFQYFGESIVSGGFDAIKCRIDTSSNDTTNYCCNPMDTVYMGEYNLDNRAEGSYYLTTNSEAPYAQGRKFNATA